MKNYILIASLFLFKIAFAQELYHDTQGKLEISNSGSATYTLPIAMPASIQDVGPIINLNYNSGQTFGIAGQGWSINSISNISRIATRRDIDGFIDGVDFDSDDKLALEGQRLLLVTGTYWADGSTYQTEMHSNTRIELFGTGASMYFVVTLPDGSRSWYGNYGGNNAVDNTAFYITRFEDTNGNYMTYQYFKPFEKSLCIKEINFSANAILNIEPQNKIAFFYEEAKRTENAYIKGIRQEKAELLIRIEVETNGNIFRKYKLEHYTDTQLGYQKVKSIQEENGAGELANPVEFVYNNTISDNDNSQIEKTYNNNIDFTDIHLSGDFDGDGKLDFVTFENQLYTKIFDGSSGSTPIDLPSSMTIGVGAKFSAVTISNNRLNQFQSIIRTVKTDTSMEYKIFNLDGNTFVNPYNKLISVQNIGSYGDPNYVGINCPGDCHILASQELGLSYDPEGGSPYYNACNENDPVNNRLGSYEGDFNGDGISEVFIINEDVVRHYNYTVYVGTNGGQNCSMTDEVVSASYYILDLNPTESTTLGTKGFVQFPINYLLNNDFKYEERFVNDFNGDGKTDILVISRAVSNYGAYKIFGFKQLTVSPWVELEILGEGVIDNYAYTRQMLFGDYNGDGKTDIMLPEEEGQHESIWNIYYSNPDPQGGEFFSKEVHDITPYWPNSGLHYDSQTHLSSYYALDVNKDGKTDLVKVWRRRYKVDWTLDDHDTQWRIYTYVNNIGNTDVIGNKFTADYISPCDEYSDCNNTSESPDLAIPVASTFRYNGMNRELVMVKRHYNLLTYINFSKDVSLDVNLIEVSSSGGNIVDNIEYNTLEPSENNNYNGLLTDFYSSADAVTYPFVEIKRLPASRVVEKITNTSIGIIKHQDFRYHGFVTDLNGMGVIGFRKTARSAWYINPNEKRIWSVSENNPFLRGTMDRSYSELLQNGTAFSFVLSGNPNGIISSTLNNYVYYTNNGLYTIFLNNSISEDFLTNVKNELTYTYLSPHILEGTVVSKNYYSGVLQGTVTTDKEYNNNPTGSGSSYYIGRPNKITTMTAAYGSTFFTEEKYSYTGNHLTKTEKKANNTDGIYITEDFEYFATGNLKTKILSVPNANPPVASRVLENTYDDSQRFVKTSKDVEGLISTIDEYHPIYGLVTKSTSPFGLITINEYDNWGKQIKTTNYLGKSTYYNYSKYNGTYISLQTGDDGSGSKAESDALGRTIRKGIKNIEGVWSYIDTDYDFMNRKVEETLPYFGSPSSGLSNTIEYDEYNRVIKTTSATNLVTTITYSGLTVTMDDETQTKSSTKNANGHVISTSDNGGQISNTYLANGNLSNSTFDGTTLSLTYDDWGRKIKLVDPSAGTYSYDYNAYGEIIEETSPNGTTTYTLDDNGKIILKKIVGNATDCTTLFTYNQTSKLLIKKLFTDNINNTHTEYNYQYDNYFRINLYDESSFQAYYQRAITFDDFGRPEKELYTAINTADGAQSDKWVKNTYKNGYHWQIIDNDTNLALWKANIVNEKGQLTNASLGNGLSISNNYDDFGFPTSINHSNSTVDIMKLTYEFDIERANLDKRSTKIGGLSLWEERFDYDLSDRLTEYTNQNGVQINQNYDNKGRITNNVVGGYSYDNSKPYQATTISFANNDVKDYYENRDPQKINYNAFKCPVTIAETNRENIDFEYNSDNSRAVMYYGDEEVDKNDRRFRKFYSADGSMEIRRDVTNNKVEFITYIGGDGYTAPIIFKSNGDSQEEYFYLHRDFQGSILAITNEDADLIEARHFDAWGSLIHYWNSSNVTTIPDAEGLLFLDRGYTGHEHLLGVGLINMNGRLYDPKIHRFLSPDNFIQEPSNTQNFNRYGYVLNNPLKYTDPSGEFAVETAMAIAAVVAAMTYTITALTSDVPFTAGGLIQSVAIASFSAAVTFGIGEACGTIGNFYLSATVQALSHGTFQGMMSGVQGGSFWVGFASAAFASLASSAWTGGNSFRHFESTGADVVTNTHQGISGALGMNNSWGMLVFGTISGGAGAKLAGGNFWQGAVTGLVVSGFNHAMHNDNGYDKNGNQINNNGGDKTDTIYNDDGSVLSTVAVKNIDGHGGFNGVLRGYGFKVNFKMATGAINEDNTIFELFVGGKSLSLARYEFNVLTGGFKQWVRVGSSYSIEGGFKTYSLRWGAGSNHWKKIGSEFFQNLNKTLRQFKLPFGGWRSADPGHFHFWKK